ncbi:LEA type 2 family protein [Parabacteroides sp. PF5-9]|uniref:LEA type 2 family protein n=1 Tax=Parabacteroides sp. PF5-9 TaxID=1742404 RepID=UPI0024757309|nr:LEA type 2 family protein [Parabacteroides sp. PF5-9]MDH6356202.1 LEA14-like dessication related protein [Parabacteroides sp. PF5-9]
MMIKFKNLFLVLATFLTLTGCDVAKQVGGAYNMVNCKYNYHSISNLTVAGMNLSNGVSLMQIPQLTSILSGAASSIPLNFTLNLDVANPNQSAALLHGLQYILSIDDIQFTTGTVSQSLNVPSGGSQVLPLTIGFDLVSMLKGDSKNAVTNIAKNFIGIGNQKSNVTLQIKPTFMIGNQAIASPVYIPVSFSFGGMK